MIKFTSYILFVTLLLFSCERRPLTYESERNCLVTFNVNWSQMPVKPQGMSVRCYPQGEGVPKVIQTNNVDVATMMLREGL